LVPQWAQAEDEHKRIIRTNPAGWSETPSLGPHHAPVIVTFYFRSWSTQTIRNITWLRDLSSLHPRDLRIEFAPIGPTSQTHHLVLAAHRQNHFWEVIETLRSSPASFDALIEKWNIDQRKHPRDSRLLKRFDQKRRRLGASSTSIVMNGRVLLSSDTKSFNALENSFHRYLNEANDRISQGVPPRSVNRVIENESFPWSPKLLVTRDPDWSEQSSRPPIFKQHSEFSIQVLPTGSQLNIHLYCSVSSTCVSSMRRVLEHRATIRDRRVGLALHFMRASEASPRHMAFASKVTEFIACASEQKSIVSIAPILIRGSKSVDHPAWLSKARNYDFDIDHIQSCLDSKRYVNILDESNRTSISAGIPGPPFLVIGDAYWSASYPPRNLESFLKQELAPGLLKRWSDRLVSPVAAVPSTYID
jgi:hypothetical protein